MYFIGDVHGRFGEYKAILKDIGEHKSIQVGDMGLGFAGDLDTNFPEIDHHYFIRGNHDNPDVCCTKKNYLGDFGICVSIEEECEHKDIFYVSGGTSHDRNMRVEGRDWWHDEVFSYDTMKSALKMYSDIRPDIVASHVAPTEIVKKMFSSQYKDPMETLLQEMFEIHKPEHWIFGHYHMPFFRLVKGTYFKGLDSLEVYQLITE